MKRLAATAFALALAAAPAAEAQTILVRPGGGSLTGLVGQPLDVPVIVDMSTHPALLGSFAMRLTWDPAVLRFTAGMPGTFGSVTINQDSVAQGILRFAGANPSGMGGTSITAAVGRFEPLLASPTTLDLTVTELFAANTFANLLPSVSVAPAFFCPALGRYGDIDGDGNANSRDALIALSNAVGLSVAPYDITLGDVDADGSTNARDALIVLSGAVGLDVSAYRVMRTAGGGCSAGPPVTFAIEPGLPGDLLPGQELMFEARAADAGGALQPVTNAAWSVSDTRVLGVLGNGQMVARDTGTADVIAIHDGRDTAFVTVRVVPRRTVHVVASTAVGAVNRVGTPALPFATIAEAAAVAQDGDTIQVRVGRYADPADLARPVVIRGDTLPNGTRPLLAGGPPGLPMLRLLGGGTVKVEHLAFDNVYMPIATFGGARLDVAGLRVGRVQYGIYVQGDLGALVVRRSIFSGGSQASNNGIASGFARIDTVLIEDCEFGDFGSWGVQLHWFGRLDVLRSTFRDQYDGLQAGTGDTLNRSGDVVVTGSRFLRHLADGLHLRAVGDVTIRDSRFELLEYDPGVSVNGARTVRMSRDTFVAVESGSAEWMDVDVADSVLLDSLDGTLQDADGYTYNVPYVRLARSTFRDVRGSVLEVFFGGGPQGSGVVEVDSVQVTGSASCQRCGTVVYANDARVTVDRLRAVNLYQGVFSYGDSTLTVTRSHFQSLYRPVTSQGFFGYPGGATVTQTTFRDWSDEAILVSGGHLTADSNTFDGGTSAIVRDGFSGGSAPVTVTRNRIANVNGGVLVGVQDSSRTVVVANNVLTGVRNTGIDLSGDMTPDTVQVRFEVQNNSVACAGSGLSQGVRVRDAHALVTDNAIACRGGIEVSAFSASSSAQRRDSVLRNTITLRREGTQQGEGITLTDNLRSTVRGNVITGDSTVASEGGIHTRQWSCSVCAIVAIIDSNLVQQLGGPGIRITRADSVTVTRNQVLDAVLFTGTAGIDLNGAYVSGHARIAGNEVRRAREPFPAGTGYGISVFNYDTATVEVDSNLVSDNHRGMYIDNYYAMGVLVTRNRVRRSVAEGIQVGANALALTIAQNNFFQNRFGMRAFSAVTAANNWWNDINGPACAVGGPCTGGPAADSVEFATVTYAPYATSEFAFTPPNAGPPAFRPAPSAGARLAAPRPSSPPARVQQVAPSRPAEAIRAREASLAERLAQSQAAREAKAARRAAEQARDDADHERRLRAIREQRP